MSRVADFGVLPQIEPSRRQRHRGTPSATAACLQPIIRGLAGVLRVRRIRPASDDPLVPFSSIRRLGILDRSRRHVHRCRRPPARWFARHAQAAVGEPRALSGCGGARDPRAAGSCARRSDSARRRRRREDGHHGRDQRAARAQGRAHGTRHHERLRRCAADRLPESAETLCPEDRAADAPLRAGDRGRRADRRAGRDRACAGPRVRAERACRRAGCGDRRRRDRPDARLPLPAARARAGGRSRASWASRRSPSRTKCVR